MYQSATPWQFPRKQGLYDPTREHDACGVGFIAHLARVVAGRRGADPESSYTSRLFAAGADRRAQKVGEEGVEVAIASLSGDEEKVADESADLLYHLLVLLEGCGVTLERVVEKLRRRHHE